MSRKLYQLGMRARKLGVFGGRVWPVYIPASERISGRALEPTLVWARAGGATAPFLGGGADTLLVRLEVLGSEYYDVDAAMGQLIADLLGAQVISTRPDPPVDTWHEILQVYQQQVHVQIIDD